MAWIVFLEEKNKKQQQQNNMAKAKSRSRRQMTKKVNIDIVEKDKTKHLVSPLNCQACTETHGDYQKPLPSIQFNYIFL